MTTHGVRGVRAPGEGMRAGRGTGDGGCGSSSGHQRALRRLTQHVDLHMGAHGELGEGGGRLLPGVRCCGVGRGWERGGERQGQDPPRYNWRVSSRSCAPPPPPGARGAPKQGAEDAVAAGRRRYSLEAQQTNTFILRHFQCRLWVGVAGDETGPERRSAGSRPAPRALRAAPCPRQRPSRLPYSLAWVAVAPPSAREAPLVPALRKLSPEVSVPEHPSRKQRPCDPPFGPSLNLSASGAVRAETLRPPGIIPGCHSQGRRPRSSHLGPLRPLTPHALAIALTTFRPTSTTTPSPDPRDPSACSRSDTS